MGNSPQMVLQVPVGSNPGGAQFKPFPQPVALDNASQPTFRFIDSELSLAYQGTTTVSGSVAAVRGAVTVAEGTTISGDSYLYGVQGKLIIQGTHDGSAEVSAGVQAQLDLSAAVAANAPIAALWADCGASMSSGIGSTAANIDGAVVYNTTATKINSALRIDTNSSVVFDLTDEGGGHGTGNLAFSSGSPATQAGGIAIKLKGTTVYIPVYTGKGTLAA
jgi:hypothetical protein